MLKCVPWEIRNHKDGVVKWELGTGVCRWTSPGQRWGVGGRKCQKSMFRHSPLCSTPGGVLCLGEGHTQVALTHHPQPQTGFATSHHPAIEKEHHLMLGPGLPSAIKAGPAFLSTAFSARWVFHLFLHLSWVREGISSFDKERKRQLLFLLSHEGPQANYIFKLNLLLMLGILRGWDSASRLLNTLLCCALVSSSVKWASFHVSKYISKS